MGFITHQQGYYTIYRFCVLSKILSFIPLFQWIKTVLALELELRQWSMELGVY